LPRIPAGARDVFSRATYADAVNVGVILTLDGSSSMNEGTRTPMAKALALHFGEACEQAGAQSMITSFAIQNQATALKNKDGFLHTLKAWHERMTATVCTRIVNAYQPDGGTHLAHGIMGCADLLAAKPDFTRRIVIALTDGGCETTPRGVTWAQDYAARKGVEVIGVLLEPEAEQQDAYGDTFPHHNGRTFGFAPDKAVIVPNASALTALVLAALAKALRD
jgi:nitric oxide reductase activation protein